MVTSRSSNIRQAGDLMCSGYRRTTSMASGKISFSLMLADFENGLKKTIMADNIIIKAPSPYNMLLGSMGLWQLQVVPSTVHGLLKFPTEEGTITIRSIPLIPS